MILAHHEIVMAVELIGVTSLAAAYLSTAFRRRLRRSSLRRDDQPTVERR
jgi:hypothetical protein